MTAKHVRYIVGAAIEFFGILTIAASDAIPIAEQFGLWIERKARHAFNAVLRLIGRPPRGHTLNATAGDTINVSMKASGTTATGARTTKDQIVYLLRRDLETQHHINQLFDRVTSVEEFEDEASSDEGRDP